MTKNADPDKYKFSGYLTEFEAHGDFSLSDGTGIGKNLIIFGTDMSSSVHIDDKKKQIIITKIRIRNILVLGKGSIDGLYDTTLTAEKEYSMNFTAQQKKNCLSLHYNRVIVINFVEIYKFKAKDSEINATPLCLGNVSKDFSVDNMNKTGLYGYVYDFLVDFNNIDVDDILDIDKYLMVNNNLK